MTRPWNRTAKVSRILAARPVVSMAGALVAAACCAAACSSGAASTASTDATGGAATATGASVTGATATGASATGATSAGATASSGTGSGGGQASSPAAGIPANVHIAPGAVLADWLHQLVVGDYKAACKDMADTSGATTSTPGPSAAAACAASATLTSLHRNFAADGLTAATPISVTAAHVTGTKATVSGNQVGVADKTLSSVMIAHSTGVTAKSFALSFKLSKVNGGWYVTDLDMDI